MDTSGITVVEEEVSSNRLKQEIFVAFLYKEGKYVKGCYKKMLKT